MVLLHPFQKCDPEEREKVCLESTIVPGKNCYRLKVNTDTTCDQKRSKKDIILHFI